MSRRHPRAARDGFACQLWLAPLVLAVAALAGCSNGVPTPAAACTSPPATIEQALRAAPGAVRLGGGTRLSDCVADTRNDSDVQSLAISLTQAADALSRSASRDAASALRLGYLLGAARRGGARNEGIDSQMIFHLQAAARPEMLAAAMRAALDAGLAAGQRNG